MAADPPRPLARNALVTGGAQRIGRAIVEMLAAEGHGVAIHFNRAGDKARALAAEIEGRGGRAVALGHDLARPDAGTLVAAAAAALGPLTVLVNNASLFERDDARSVTAESWDRHMAINARAPALLARAFAAQAPAGADCCIVNLLDQKLWNQNPDFFSYTASKVALHGLNTMLAMALAPVRVCGVAPGLTLPSEKMSAESFARAHVQTPLHRGSTPADVAAAVRYLIAAPAVTGDVLIVDGGQHLVRRGRDVMFEVK
ncbi:MAG: SDR family oxidoreductase [Alphaproteobacteria bacterium]|nr:SDR family oxidoreductase [Alphaproteobacteria bacterium]